MTDCSSGTPVAAIYHADALPTGTRLGEFEIVSLLGVGGFGMVYQAFDHSLHRSVAIKEYMPSSLAGRTIELSVAVRALPDVLAFEAGLRSFMSEARMLAQFDHPSLVKVFRFWEAHHTAYMVMPLYNGMTFKQARLQMRTPPPEAWLRQVLWSVLGALRTLHDGHTLHRDISPDNIFLQDIGPPVLLDLGAARQAISDRDRKHTAVLKVNYAPIEQYASGDADLPQGPWSDLYSLATVVYGCLCNDMPVPSTLRAIRDRMVPFARVARTVEQQLGQAYSPSFVNAITQALALQPQDRPQSIDAFLQLLEMDSAPAPLEFFDFRAGLGSLWVEPTDQPSPGQLPTIDLSTAYVAEPATVVAAPTAAPIAPPTPTSTSTATTTASPSPSIFTIRNQSMDAGDTMLLEDVPDTLLFQDQDGVTQNYPQSVGLESSWTERTPRRLGGAATGEPVSERRPWVLWASVAGVVAVVTAGVGFYTSRAATTLAAKDTIITEMADPVPKLPAPAAPAVALPAPAPPPAPAVVEAPAPVLVEAPASAPVPAFVETTDPRAASHSVAPKPAPRKTAPPAPAPAPSPAPAPAPPPVVANDTSARTPVSRPKPPPTVCADSNALTRSMCLRSECRQPALARLPVCVEFRNRMDSLEVHSPN